MMLYEGQSDEYKIVIQKRMLLDPNGNSRIPRMEYSGESSNNDVR